MTTIELVKKLKRESSEVKNSVGGAMFFRNVMDTMLSLNNGVYDEKFNYSHHRSDEEIAQELEKQCSTEDILQTKSLF